MKINVMANNARIYQLALGCIALILLVRFISLGAYPLFDTTEARYGEMARLMVETGNWITPLFDYHVPFWGKPPGHTWLSALSMTTIGVGEFAARLPHFICGLLTLWLVFRFTRTISNQQTALHAVLVLSTSLGFVVASGMVMTDTALLLSTTLTMTSFWLNFQGINSRLNGHLFFVGIALGLLIKGPVAVVFAGIALVIWSIWQGQFIKAIKSLPWLSGMILCLVITLPWYIAAEIATPGFLQYFIVGEHIERFLVPGWQGDLYGSAHKNPKGMIWVYWLACAFPWSFWLVKEWLLKGWLAKLVSSKKANQTTSDQKLIQSYLLCWLVAPLLLFTAAGNILPVYTLPGFAGMAIYLSLRTPLTKGQVYSAIATVLIASSLITAVSLGLTSKSSEKQLLLTDITKADINKADATENHPVYYWHKRPFSAQFYSAGQAKKLTQLADLQQLIAQNNTFYLVVRHKEYANLAEHINDTCVALTRYKKKGLYLCQ